MVTKKKNMNLHTDVVIKPKLLTSPLKNHQRPFVDTFIQLILVACILYLTLRFVFSKVVGVNLEACKTHENVLTAPSDMKRSFFLILFY